MRIYRFLLCLIIFTVLFGCNSNNNIIVQEAEKETNPDIIEEKKPSTFMWELEYNGKTNYILGSIHLGTQELYPLDDAIEDSFEKSDILVLEADITKGSDKAVMDLIKEIAYYKDGRTIKDSISAENYEMIRDKMKEKGYDISLFQNFKPWFLAISILPLEMVKMGFSPYLGIEMHFVKKSQEKKMEIMELEGIEYQLRLFDSFPEELQEMFLVDSFLELDTMKTQMEEIIKSWKSGDSESLFKYLFDAIEKQPKLEKFYEKLNDERNIEMAEKIIEYFNDEKTYFIVVGSLHLIGEKGVIELLKNKGVNTEQI